MYVGQLMQEFGKGKPPTQLEWDGFRGVWDLLTGADEATEEVDHLAAGHDGTPPRPHDGTPPRR
eukprot:COSAG01_NODE_11742_length_1868_cov_16.333522_2_plen_64_part_00